MRVGFGRWEVTPPMGIELAGYGYYLGRCAETVRDPLYARALLLEEGFEADYFKSSNVDGGDAWNDRLIDQYKDMIPGLL